MGAVVNRRLEGAPEEKLVYAAVAAIGVATDEIHVHGFEICG